MTSRVIATSPDAPVKNVELSPAEELARQNESDAAALSELRKRRRHEFKAEALTRIAAQVPAWNTFERIEFLLSISNMLNTGNMTAAQTLAKDTLVYVRDTAIPKLTGLTLTQLQLIDPTLADPFGDGTLWPV